MLVQMVLQAIEVRELVAGLSPSPPHFTGFTTYLRTVLMRGIQYRAPAVRTAIPRRPTRRAQRAQHGLVLGRRLDSAFRRYAETGVSGSLTSVVAAVLRRRGIVVVGSQPVVHVRRLRVKTALDGVGVDASGTVWIIELKNTQRTLAEHHALYDVACPNNQFLSNGQQNTERVRHALQAGFGVLGFKQGLPGFSQHVRALVVVNCTDGAVGYSVDCAKHASPASFPPATSVVTPQDGGVWDARNAELRRLVARLGFDWRTHRRASSGTVGVYKRGKQGKATRCLAIGIGRSSCRALMRQSADVRAVVISRGQALVAEVL